MDDNNMHEDAAQRELELELDARFERELEPDVERRGFRVRAHGELAKEAGNERVLLVGVQFSGVNPEASERHLDELAALVASAGGEVVGRVLQRRERPDPATFIGKGKTAEVAALAAEEDADTIVFDEELSPAQLRNLDEALPGKVLDRTILILDIFAQRARSTEGKKQVELAQLTYGLPRLRGWGESLSRIGGAAGGTGTGGGGAGAGRGPIGTRGPGETQLEIDRRRIQERLHKLRRELEVLGRRRRTARTHRRQQVDTVALAGYTNAGKSTVLNTLTAAGVLVEDRLFSTLDPTTRKLELPDGRTVVLTDTVGFIRKLPHGLVEAFKSTLEEISESDVIVHVVDASREDPDEDIGAVDEVLAEIGAADARRIVALNKWDVLDDAARQRLQAHYPHAVPMSALSPDGLTALLAAIAIRLDERVARVEAVLPYDQGALLARLHDQGRVVHATHEDEGVRIVVKATAAELGLLDRFLVQ